MLVAARRPRVHAPLLLALSLGTACGDAAGDATQGSTGAATATATDGSSSGGAASTSGGDETGQTTAVPDPTTSTGGPPPTTGGTAEDPSSGGETGDGTTGEPVDPAAKLFAPGTIAQFDIKLSQAAIASLDADPKIYVSADLVVTIDGEVTGLADIGVRLKGNYGSFRKLDQKAAFLLNFDRYVDGQKLFGMEKLAVNNMVQDHSMEREILGYELFRAGGVPAPRAANATVSVNGEPYGLYATVETVDNKEFLEAWYGDAKGALYEGAYGSDLFVDLVPSFDQDNGDNIDFMDLTALATALDGIVDPEDFVPVISELVDLDLYLTMAATEIYLGHWDGYAWTRNNFFLYRRPSDDRWVWMPWGIDQTMNDYLDPFGGKGRMNQLCDESLACRKLLAAKFEEVVARVDALGLAATAQTLADTLRPAAEADPRKEYSIDSVDGSVAGNIDFLTNRGKAVMDQLICTDPSLVDGDMDGFSGCGEDCDDGDPKKNPGAPEVCDLDDDNCDGAWDNDPKCPQCIKQKLPAPLIGNAAFCFGGKTFAEAEADCVKQGGHLLAIHDAKLQAWATMSAFAINNTDWWIGLNDLKAEGTFVWTDATKVDFLAWAGGEPNNAGDEDCGHLAPWAGGGWNDMFCGQVRPYICRVP